MCSTGFAQVNCFPSYGEIFIFKKVSGCILLWGTFCTNLEPELIKLNDRLRVESPNENHRISWCGISTVVQRTVFVFQLFCSHFFQSCFFALIIFLCAVLSPGVSSCTQSYAHFCGWNSFPSLLFPGHSAFSCSLHEAALRLSAFAVLNKSPIAAFLVLCSVL